MDTSDTTSANQPQHNLKKQKTPYKFLSEK